MVYDVVIVGGGHGGAQTAMKLRLEQFQGSIAIVGDEAELPYDRPPLSKEYLSGEKPFERMLFKSAQAWADIGVSLLPGRRVSSVDADRREVITADGALIGYGFLVWSAGGSARRLSCSGSELAGVHSIRSRADVDRLADELPEVRDVAVIGGGYIGLEAAAVLTKFGKRVTLLEAQDRVLARVAGEPLSRFYEGEHRARGVNIRLGAAVSCIEAEHGRACGVLMADGETLPAQIVIVGIGIAPAVAPLIEAGANGGNGVRVDEYCRTSLADVYAIGDCVEHRNYFAADEWVRVESVQNATDQATVAARAICGRPEPYRAVPWFWSNQYDLRLQTVGLSRGFDDMVVRGDPAQRSFSIVYLREGRVIALDCVNSVRDYSHGRLLVVQRTRCGRERLADAAIPLKTLIAA